MQNSAHINRPLNELGVTAIVRGVHAGHFAAADVVRSCLERISERGPAIRAWVAVSNESGLQQAMALGHKAALPLAGVPFGVKDVLDTSELPTEMGSQLYAGHRPSFDAACVGRVRAAGAVMIGKTVTAEFAGTQPTHTRNPHDPARTPGGSSSGSAAAVADFMVPFAFGTQTGGSVLRPASFCGVVGFKPSFGFYPVAGMKPAARSFDTVGLLARHAEDIALLHAVLMNGAAGRPHDAPPRLGVFRSHLWDTVHPDTQDAMERALADLRRAGAQVSELQMPEGFDTITAHRAVINAHERAGDLAAEWDAGHARVSAQTRDVCQRGMAIDADRYIAAREAIERFRSVADVLFGDADLLVMPTAPGPAPQGHDNAGDPRLQEIWTALHMPSISLPVLRSSDHLPVGLQLVGRRFHDGRLLHAAQWIEAKLLPAQ